MNTFKVSVLILTALLIYLQINLWVGEGSLANVWKLKKEQSRLVEKNQQLMERNATMAAEVKNLKSGLDAIEERARMELGMIKKDETFYLIIDERPLHER